MARTTKRRRWSYSAGQRGRNRVTVRDRSDRPDFYILSRSAPDPRTGRARRHKTSLGRIGRDLAKQKADELAARFAGGNRVAPTPPAPKFTFGELLRRYEADVTPTKTHATQLHDRIVFALIREEWGDACEPLSLDRSDWDRFLRRRLDGSLSPSTGRRGVPVRANTVAHDARTIKAILTWGCQLRRTDGEPALPRHPFAGFPLPKLDEPPPRPRLDADELTKMRAAATRLGPLHRLAFTLAESTGHRSGSIRQLVWSDIDLGERSTILWRGATDKSRHRHVVPIEDATAAVLQAERARVGAIGERLLFPSAYDPSRPMSASAFRGLWYAIVEAAGISSVRGRAWHALRRNWADASRDMAPADAARLGGWTTPTMLLTVYQTTTQDTLRTALSKRRSLA